MERQIEIESMKDYVKVFGDDASVDKVKRYNWEPSTPPGQFMMISKNEIKIDLSYQREEVSGAKIIHIAKTFDWALFGVVSVVKSKDGYFAFDGGHRLRAAKLRSDVKDIPCMVFSVNDVSSEADLFLDKNTLATNVKALDKHRAGLVSKRMDAIIVEKLVRSSGYKFASTAAGEFTTAAVGTVYRMVKKNATVAEKSFSILAKVAQGMPIKNEELTGLHYLITVNPSIDFETFPLNNMLRVGIGKVQEEIQRYKHYKGKGGEKVYAEGMLTIINHGQQKQKVVVIE